jgi:UDP-glucose 4-epimerase
MNVLVTGGAGYIGSVVVEQLLGHGDRVVVYDNLVKGHRAAVAPGATLVEGDLLDRQRLVQTLTEQRIEAVIHMAAYSLVGESVQQPHKYFVNNLSAGVILLDAMLEVGIQRLVFSSTAAVYGEPERVPITEDAPQSPTNPYGESKLAFERALHWYDAAYGVRYASLRYFNAAGATTRCGEDHDPESHLIPLVLKVAAGERDCVQIFGDDYPTPDGTCVRDYIHVIDLADAHVLALRHLDEASRIANLGYGGGYSVRQVVETARQVTGRPIHTEQAPRRAGDPAVLIASSDKMTRELGWRPRLSSLECMIESAWCWHLAHPSGYGK